ncbi:MAG TPA: hypothetical protein VFJ82_07095 [Longimicrobium sp.]|nr:hypothetical protein [Longimicrobium sp.]
MSTTLDPAPPDAGLPPAPRRGEVPPYDHGRGGGWRGVLREFAVIVAGVLCALAAQAWWDAHQERGRERDYLRQILADTRANARRLDEAIRTDSTAVWYGNRAMDVLTDTGPAPPADSLVAWIDHSARASDFQPLAGNYRALIGTGDLRLVRNDSLRARLAAYAATLDSEVERQRQFRTAVSAQIGAMVRALPFMKRAFLPDLRATGVSVQRLRDDPDAGAVLFAQLAATSNRVNGLRSLRTETHALLRALQAEPGVEGGAASPD